MGNITILEALLISLLGILVVFVCLFIIYVMIQLIALFFKNRSGAETPAAAAPSAIGAPADDGAVKLYGVTPKEAAAIMAIVSDETDIPLENLRFKSIKAID